MVPEFLEFADRWDSCPEDPEAACRTVGFILHQLAQQRCIGELSESRFVDAVLSIQTDYVLPAGLALTVCNTVDGWTAVQLRRPSKDEPSTYFEFLPETGEFRTVRL